MAGWIWIVEVDTVKGGYKIRVMGLGGVIIVKNYRFFARVNRLFFFLWKMMNLVLLVLTAILLLLNHCAHFFNLELTLSISSGRFLPALSP